MIDGYALAEAAGDSIIRLMIRTASAVAIVTVVSAMVYVASVK